MSNIETMYVSGIFNVEEEEDKCDLLHSLKAKSFCLESFKTHSVFSWDKTCSQKRETC